jgi:hypothetical protein
MAKTTPKAPSKAAPKGPPKTIKLPWANSNAIAASPDGRLVLAAGDLGAIASIDTVTWKAALWPKADGFVNSLSISDDGSRVAVGVTGHGAMGEPHIELRDASGAITARVRTKRNPRVAWSPSGVWLVARIEADVDHPSCHVAIVDVAAATLRHVELGPTTDSVVACFLDDGETILAFARRQAEDAPAVYTALHISTSGAVREAGASSCEDAFKSLHRLGSGRYLVAPYNHGWHLVNRNGGLIAEGERPSTPCATPDGFASAYSSVVSRFSRDGEKLGADFKAKKRVDGIAVAGGHLLLLQAGQIELTTV